jgi:Tripartite tricarboxylate transporter family receptor
MVMGNLGTHAASLGIYQKLAYDPRTDFEPVILVASTPMVLVTRKTLPVHNLDEAIACAKTNKGKTTMGSAGVGSISHLTLLLFNHLTGADVTHVPYRGLSEATNDLLGGQIDMLFDQVVAATPAATQADGLEAARTQSNYFLRLVVGLAVAPQRRGPGAGIVALKARSDLGVLALEQAVAVKVALDQKWTELLYLKHPDGLRQAEFLEPIHIHNALDAAAEERAGAVAHRGEIDRAVRHKKLAVDLGCHAAFADDDVASGEPEPAVEPLRETK